MLSFIKFLKIALPVATVTSATIATTFLVSSSRNDLSNKGKEEDSILTDFVNLVEDFKEKTLFYSKKGDGDGTVSLSEEESQKLQDLIDKGVDISKLGEKPDNVPDAAGALSKTPDKQTQVDQTPEAVMEPRDNAEIAPNVKEQNLSDIKADGGLDSSNQSDNPDLGNVQRSDEITDGDSEDISVAHDDENKEQKNQLLDEKEDTKKGEAGGDIQQEEGQLEGEPQINEINADNSHDLGQREKDQRKEQDEDALPETKTVAEINGPQNGDSDAGAELKSEEQKNKPNETGEKSSQDQLGNEGSKNNNQEPEELSRESEGHQSQQQNEGEGDLSGDSDVTRFNLAELQRWQNELGSAKDALSEILSRL